MRQKSKFVTFLLSFVPGLSHFYLGYADRGLIYLLTFGGIIFGTIALGMITGHDEVLVFLVALPIIWLIALIDSMSIINNTRYNPNIEGNSVIVDKEAMKLSNRKIITLALSVIPGAGHMYLGYQKKGLVLMGGFFFAIFFMGWLNLSFLLFLLPLIWFYSFFDAFHTLNGNDVEDIDIARFLPSIKSEYIGKGLIGIGVLIALQKILYPILSSILSTYIDYQIVYQIGNYIQTSIVSLIFIIGGIKILQSRKQVEAIEEDEDNEE